MEDFEYEIEGVSVKTDDKCFKPHNPLHRPEIKYKKFCISFILFFVLGAVVFALSDFILKNAGVADEKVYSYSLTVSIIACGVYILFILKKGIVWLVHFYQHFAPERMRLRCVFEPSCSEYMILAIEKYGVMRGLGKGIVRLFRCHPPGGVDYP